MAVIINSGDLNKRVVFMQPSSSLNDEAGIEKTFAPGLTAWAAVKNFNERRVTEAHASALIGSLDFYVRYSSTVEAIDKDWLLVYNGEDYTIHEIEQMDQEANFVKFTAKVRTNG